MEFLFWPFRLYVYANIQRVVPWLGDGVSECLNVMIIFSTKSCTVIIISISSTIWVFDWKLQWIECSVILKPEKKGSGVFNTFITRVPAMCEIASKDRVVCVVQNSGTLAVTLLLKRLGRTSLPVDLVQQLEVTGSPKPRHHLVFSKSSVMIWLFQKRLGEDWKKKKSHAYNYSSFLLYSCTVYDILSE